jgi:hypothetical protein
MDEQINSTINGKSPLPEAFRGDLSQGSLAVAGGPNSKSRSFLPKAYRCCNSKESA